ncbi:hypothetical protein AMATHDRAFT_6169 [Amanita thiersii Skay4041]|uniref:Uncharacterized protein n=1 Tax=Amanita thiersii Skay4041 TaxID=703135 RepID=A0A2A9NFE5_9AGAR|nr:hypothetical protein AMATHDRAFT_6169 [Amanita thiersii Skay4041]
MPNLHKLDNLPSDVNYTGNWRNEDISGPDNNASIYWTDGNSSITLEFKGMRIAVYGVIPSNTSAPSADFLIDDTRMTTTTPSLGDHTLVIKIEHSTMGFEFLLVDDNTLPSTSVQTSNTRSPVLSTHSTTPDHTPKSHTMSPGTIAFMSSGL